jgi:lambda family phage portal protein
LTVLSIIRRFAAKLLARGYEAAGASGRWPAAAMMTTAPARQAEAARPRLAAGAAHLLANAPIAESAANTFCTGLVGDGPSVRSAHPNRAVRRALESAWNRFYRHADIEGGDLLSLLIRIVLAFFSDGEAFIRLLTTERGELRLQLLSPSQIDASVNRELPDGSRIVAGIEVGPNGERLAYHVLPEAPDGFPIKIGPAVRVPAEDMCHVFESRMPGQMRGVSWLHSVLTRILELDAAEDAALVKLKTTALMCGFIRDVDGTAFGDANKATDPAQLSMEPATMRLLPPGTEVQFTPTSEMGEIGAFLKHMSRSIAYGIGVPYCLVADDLADVNYSSARTGLQNFWRRCAAIRASVLVARFLQPVWERFVTLEILSGRLNAPDFDRDSESYFEVSFLWPQPAALDPLKETNADIAAMNAKLRSRQEIISARGRDPAEVDSEIAADQFRDTSGQVVPINPDNPAEAAA